jgi:hypothetical protein
MYVFLVLVPRYDYDIFILCNFEKKNNHHCLQKYFHKCVFLTSTRVDVFFYINHSLNCLRSFNNSVKVNSWKKEPKTETNWNSRESSRSGFSVRNSMQETYSGQDTKLSTSTAGQSTCQIS